MKLNGPTKITIADKVRGWFSSDYAARTSLNRYIENHPRVVFKNSARHAADTRTTVGWSTQPWGPNGFRTLTPSRRRNMVQRARAIDEDNLLGSAMLDRCVDNVIGQGMTFQARTTDDEFNKDVEAAMKEVRFDARGMMSNAELQWQWFRRYMIDGDIGLLLLKSGQIQTIESDYIQSPFAETTKPFRGNEIIEGVEINIVGRARAFHIAASSRLGERISTRVSERDLILFANHVRMNREAVRGTSTLAQISWALEQIDGTVESVVMAHRMAAMYGLIHKRANPGSAFSALPATATTADGDSAAEILLEPAMVNYIGQDDDIVQIKPEHPSTNFDGFMTFMIRFAGSKMGLPLEIAMLDFSKTNYSSARASMEQAYRRFRILQDRFASTVMSRIYRWRVSKLVKDGILKNAPDDFFEHQVFGQPWPYLDPQKEAEGTLVAIDAGLTTLTDELGRRGYTFGDWIEQRKAEFEALVEAEIPLTRSNRTREIGQEAQDITETDDNAKQNNADD